MRSQQATQKGGHDIHARNREFTVGTRVLVGDLRDPSHWNPDIVCECHGPLSYVVEMDSGETIHWHVDHLQKLVSVSQERMYTPTPQYPQRQRRPVERLQYS